MAQTPKEFPLPDMGNTQKEIESILIKLAGEEAIFTFMSIVDSSPTGSKVGYIFHTKPTSHGVAATPLIPLGDVPHVARFLAGELENITPPNPRAGVVVGEKTWMIVSRFIGDTEAIWAIAGYALVNTTPQ